jgi:hypothetical protein
MKRRLLHVLIALDQLAYVLITLGNGYPDETLSSAAYRLELRGHFWGRFWRPIIDWLFRPVEKNHCQQAYNAERLRLQAHPDTR